MSTAADSAPGFRALLRDVVRSTRGHDLLLYAAGVTFYAAVAFVPLLLVTLWIAGLLVGDAQLRTLAGGLAALLPSSGAQRVARMLSDAGSSLGWGRAVAALVPASLYGEGLVRAFDRLSRGGRAGRRSLRGRLGSLVLVAVTPLLLLAGLWATRGLTRALGSGLGPQLLGVYFAFLVTWLVISTLVCLAFRVLAPRSPGVRALLWGGFATGSFLAGTSLGYVLFLAFGLNLGGAYGGSSALASAAVALGWLWLLHVMALAGYVLTLRLDARDGHPLALPVHRTEVRAAA